MELDLSLLLDDVGKPVVVGGQTITGIRDKLPAHLFDDRAPVGASRITVLCRTADLPALAEGMALTYDGTPYVVQFWEPDANTLDGDWTRIYLESV